MTYLHNMVFNISLKLWRPLVVYQIWAMASSNESSGSKKSSLRNDRVPWFSTKVIGVACTPNAIEASKNVKAIFHREVRLSSLVEEVAQIKENKWLRWLLWGGGIWRWQTRWRREKGTEGGRGENILGMEGERELIGHEIWYSRP